MVTELAGLIALVAVATYLLYAFGLFEFFADRQRLIAFIREHRAYAMFIFIGLQVVQVVAAPVPGEVTGFAGGVLFGTFWGIVFSTIGLTLGSWLAFGLARLIGRPIVELVTSHETIKRYDYVMKHKGLFLAFLMFLIPGFPKDILCYILGLGHMGQRDFLIVSTTGRLLGTTLLTIGGTLFRNERYGAFFTVLGISIAMILLVMIYRENIERWFRSRRVAQRLKSREERLRMKKRKKD
jgi:uncharacterized membrane protein YdjX (TVP38/TMEM64 family)